MPQSATAKTGRRADEVTQDASALQAEKRGIYSETARKSTEARISWWCAKAERRKLKPFPLDKDKLLLGGLCENRAATAPHLNACIP